MLACDGPPGYPGHGHLAPGIGLSLFSWSLWTLSLVCLALLSLARCGLGLPPSWPRLPLLSAHLRQPFLEAHHSGAPGAWLWCLQAHRTCLSLCLFAPSMVRSLFLLWSPCVFAPMSRGDHLRQLAAQLTMLAALEDSVALGISRVMGAAGSGGFSAFAAAGLSAASAAVAAPVASASSRARSRSRSPAPLPKRAPRRSSSTAPCARGSVVLADPGLVTGLAVKSCPPVPPAQLRLSRASLRSNLARLPRLLHALHQPLWLPVLQMLRPTLTPIGTPSSTLMASPRLPAAPQPPSPSRPTPLVLVGLLATSAAVACGRPPSAPYGSKFERSPRDCSALRHRSARWGRLLLA